MIPKLILLGALPVALLLIFSLSDVSAKGVDAHPSPLEQYNAGVAL